MNKLFVAVIALLATAAAFAASSPLLPEVQSRFESVEAGTSLATGAVVEAKIGTGAVTNTKLGSGSVTLAKMASGVSPLYVPKYAGSVTSNSITTITIAVTGAAATDFPVINIKTAGSTPRSVLSATAGTNKVEVLMSGDPSTDHVLQYMVLRAATE